MAALQSGRRQKITHYLKRKTMFKEFKEFALKGNLIDMAIAFVMGGAFGKVSTAFVEGMVAPVIGMLLGGVDLTQKKWVLKAAEIGADGKETAAEVAINWGTFITATIDFLVVAFVMFMVVKAINSMKRKEAEIPAAPPADIQLLTEIRNLLKK